MPTASPATLTAGQTRRLLIGSSLVMMGLAACLVPVAVCLTSLARTTEWGAPHLKGGGAGNLRTH